MTVMLFLILFLFVTGVQSFIPYLVKRNVVFGVTIPEAYLKHEMIRSYKKRYTILMLNISLFIAIGYLLWAILQSPSEQQLAFTGAFIVFAIIIISLTSYFYFHGKTTQLKRQNRWMSDLKQIQVADLSARAKDEMLPWYLYLLPIALTIGLGIYTMLQYDLLPDQIPTHWGPTGADAFTEKTPFSAVSLSLTLFLMQIMFLGIHFGTRKSGIKVHASSTSASLKRSLKLRKYTSWFMYFITLLITMLFSYLQLQMIHPDILGTSTLIWLPLLFIGIILIGTIVFALKVGKSDKEDFEHKEDSNVTGYDDDAHWKGGLFYFNKNDPSIFVEKRFGVGWTLNFANPIGYIITLLPIIILILIAILQ